MCALEKRGEGGVIIFFLFFFLSYFFFLLVSSPLIFSQRVGWRQCFVTEATSRSRCVVHSW